MVHNYYLEKAKKSAQLQKDKDVNGKPSMIDLARLPNTANGCKPKPRNWQASMSIWIKPRSCMALSLNTAIQPRSSMSYDVDHNSSGLRTTLTMRISLSLHGMMSVPHQFKGLVLHQKTTDHKPFEHGNSRPQQSNRQGSKLGLKGVPLAVKTSYIHDKSCHKVVRLGINPMIQPEPEDLPKDNPKLEIAVLRIKKKCMDKGSKERSPPHNLRQKPGQYICCQNHKLIADIENDIMDPVMQCTTLPSHSGFSQQKLVSFVTEIHTLSIDISFRDR
ncbi:hypothetical protein Tco_0554200 [Tanacetum coccineum]